MSSAAPPPQPPHIVVFPSPGMGHLIPLTEFAKRLVSRFTFTFAVPTAGPPPPAQRAFLSSLPAGIRAVFLPAVDVSDAPSDARIETLMSLIVARSLPSLRGLLAGDRGRVAVLVVDLFGTDAFDVAADLGVSPYIFYPSTAMALSLFLHLERLDETVPCEYADLAEPVRIPGCVPVQGRDLLEPLQDRRNDAYKWVLHHCKRYKLAEGIIVNSFEAVEPGAIRELLRPEPGHPPVYPVGPLVQTGSANPDSACVNWLDDQPRGSVLFVNFGSGGSLSTDQQNELAHGLARSKQRFLWVIRPPNDAVANATYFTVDGESVDPLRLLPEGFLSETAGRGLVVPKWAPQVEVLAHGSTGGFLTHCGWNSVLESLVHGVPMITWPLYAEQKMNTVILTEDVRVGLRPTAGENGFIRGDEIGRVVVELMEGEGGREIRKRVKEVKGVAQAALSEGGSSSRVLGEIARRWESKV